jgi:N-acetylmuramoyl-L-alanine amidase
MNSSHVSKFFFFCLLLFLAAKSGNAQQPLRGKVICLDPGHGGTAATDTYRQGPSGEREEWVNLRVAQYLRAMLEERGAEVVMTRTRDEAVPLARRAEIAREVNADVFLSIHHNATADSSVNFPIIYFHGNASENQAGVALAIALGEAFQSHIHQPETPVSVVSDHVIFAGAGAAVLRGTYGIPAVLAEASFFTNPSEEQRLKDTAYNRREAMAYLDALTGFFSKPVHEIYPKHSRVTQIPPFRALQEAERMNPEARRWFADYIEGLELMKRSTADAWQRAYDCFTRSARAFPDSHVARGCHKHRAALLSKLGRKQEAAEEALRAKEFYVTAPEDTAWP